jgi:hypothetical protein
VGGDVHVNIGKTDGWISVIDFTAVRVRKIGVIFCKVVHALADNVINVLAMRSRRLFVEFVQHQSDDLKQRHLPPSLAFDANMVLRLLLLMEPCHPQQT